MAELLAIKRELTVIKVQIDGLLDCVDEMDRQRTDCSGRDTTQLDCFLSLTTVYMSYKNSTDIFTPVLKPNPQSEKDKAFVSGLNEPELPAYKVMEQRHGPSLI